MMTSERIWELYEANKKDIMKAVRKIPQGYHIEVAFYNSGTVWISDLIGCNAWMDWHPDFWVHFGHDRFMSYRELKETIAEQMSKLADEE